MKVVKRDGAVVEFEVGKIIRAIEKAKTANTVDQNMTLNPTLRCPLYSF